MIGEILSGGISFALGHTLLQIPFFVWEGQMISQENRASTLEAGCLRQTSVTSTCTCVYHVHVTVTQVGFAKQAPGCLKTADIIV